MRGSPCSPAKGRRGGARVERAGLRASRHVQHGRTRLYGINRPERMVGRGHASVAARSRRLTAASAPVRVLVWQIITMRTRSQTCNKRPLKTHIIGIISAGRLEENQPFPILTLVFRQQLTVLQNQPGNQPFFSILRQVHAVPVQQGLRRRRAHTRATPGGRQGEVTRLCQRGRR